MSGVERSSGDMTNTSLQAQAYLPQALSTAVTVTHLPDRCNAVSCDGLNESNIAVKVVNVSCSNGLVGLLTMLRNVGVRGLLQGGGTKRDVGNGSPAAGSSRNRAQ